MPPVELSVFDKVVQSSVWALVSLVVLDHAVVVVALALWTEMPLPSYQLEDACIVHNTSQDDTYPANTTIWKKSRLFQVGVP